MSSSTSGSAIARGLLAEKRRLGSKTQVGAEAAELRTLELATVCRAGTGLRESRPQRDQVKVTWKKPLLNVVSIL